MPVVLCPHCSTPVPDTNIDHTRQIATCGACGRLIDLRHAADNHSPAVSESPQPRLRAPVALPAGMQIRAGTPDDRDHRSGLAPPIIVIERRWLRAKHYVLLTIFLGMSAAMALLWTRYEFSVMLLFGTIVLLMWNYNLLTMFVNRTVIRAGRDKVEVSHGPLPTVFFRPKSVLAASVRQLFAVGQMGRYLVKAQLHDGSVTMLVWPLTSAEQALFIEQQLESALKLVDFEVPGELGAALPEGISAPGGNAGASGGAAVAIIVPALIAGALTLFYFMGASEVSGSLTARGDAGDWAFRPDDCRSGQLSGFVGVELLSTADPERVIRLIRDPVRGNLVIVDTRSASRPNLVLGADQCTQLDINVERTSTNINDVWVVEGSARIACKVLSGEIAFAGCH